VDVETEAIRPSVGPFITAKSVAYGTLKAVRVSRARASRVT